MAIEKPDDPIERLLDDLVAGDLLQRANLTAPALMLAGLHAVHDDEVTLTEAAARRSFHPTTLRRTIDR